MNTIVFALLVVSLPFGGTDADTKFDVIGTFKDQSTCERFGEASKVAYKAIKRDSTFRCKPLVLNAAGNYVDASLLDANRAN